MYSAFEGPSEGRQARRRQATRQLIADSGLRLFETYGYSETTIDKIADAAGISRRTFFSHFAAKEDLVFAWKEESTKEMTAALRRAPETCAPIDAVELALGELAHHYTHERMILIDRITRATPSLLESRYVHHARQEQVLLRELRAKWPDLEAGLGLQIVAMGAIGVLRLAADNWSADGHSRPYEAYLREGFAALRRFVGSGFEGEGT